MKLTFLGTGAGNYRGGGRHPSSAIVEGLLLDCGAGATGRLHDLHRFDEVEAVLLSHLHTDHVAGLFDLLLHAFITGRTRPLTIVSPPGLSPILRAFVAADAMVKDPATLYDLRVVEELQPAVHVGKWTVRGVPLSHTVPDLGYLAVSDGLSLFYTGDTREPTATHALHADVLIHEATFDEEHRTLAHQLGHSTGAGAGDAAAAMKARRLFLTHLGDAPDLATRVAHEGRGRFGDTEVASDGATYDL
ncbi:MAG TPA: MBL fold metallo-hydrolase [Thermoplasmata archaeon]|nr:MBL fold metallo-hydrolase [Thermoplasmata archaeon]